jgi:uncharacterized protein (UPF0333 family)
MSKSKKSLIVIGAVVVVVIVIIIAASFYLGQKNAAQNAPTGGGSASVQANQAVEASAAAIIKSGDAAQCASVNTVVDGANYETVCKNNIAWNAAQANLDINACNGLDNQLMSVADCQNSVIIGLIVKGKTLSVCDQFTGAINTTCVDDYWFQTAATKQNPSLCKNVISSSSQADIGCEYNVLLSSVSVGTSTPKCSLFAGAVKTDCTNYMKHDCQAVTFPPLQQACQQGIK